MIQLLRLKDLIIKTKHNTILVIVNKLIKYSYIIFFKKKKYNKVTKNYCTQQIDTVS